MVSLGVAEILGAFFIGAIVDRQGSKLASLVNGGFILFAAGIVFCLILSPEKPWLGLAACFLWGFQDALVNTHTQEVVSFEFEKVQRGFALY